MDDPAYRRVGRPVTTAGRGSLAEGRNERAEGAAMFRKEPAGVATIVRVRAAAWGRRRATRPAPADAGRSLSHPATPAARILRGCDRIHSKERIPKNEFRTPYSERARALESEGSSASWIRNLEGSLPSFHRPSAETIRS